MSIIKQLVERTRKTTDFLLKLEPFKYSSLLPWIESISCKGMLVHFFLIPIPFTDGKKKKKQTNYMEGKVPQILEKIELSQRNPELGQLVSQLLY